MVTASRSGSARIAWHGGSSAALFRPLRQGRAKDANIVQLGGSGFAVGAEPKVHFGRETGDGVAGDDAGSEGLRQEHRAAGGSDAVALAVEPQGAKVEAATGGIGERNLCAFARARFVSQGAKQRAKGIQLGDIDDEVEVAVEASLFPREGIDAPTAFDPAAKPGRGDRVEEGEDVVGGHGTPPGCRRSRSARSCRRSSRFALRSSALTQP